MPLHGRIEKRVPMVVPAYLVSVEERFVTERVLMENVSPHGARVVAKQCWQPGEQPRLVPLLGESASPARVVYCQGPTNGHFYLGLEFWACSIKWENALGVSTA
jgi:hypothetical protein